MKKLEKTMNASSCPAFSLSRLLCFFFFFVVVVLLTRHFKKSAHARCIYCESEPRI